MPLKLSNNAIGTLASSMTNSSTSVVLAPGQGAKFPVLGSGDWFPITVVRASDPNQFEIMHATARSGDILTVTRAREGTTAITFSVGDVVEHRLTRDAMDRDFVRLGPSSLDGVRVSVSNDGSNLKTTVHANNKEEQLARQKDIDALGTAATRDVTTSATDTTSGRVMQVGDFGWGSDGSETRDRPTDLNDVLVSGMYPVSGGTVNAPLGDQAGILLVYPWENSTVAKVQEITSNGTPVRRFIRSRRTSGDWSDWEEVLHSGNLDPVETSRQIIAGTGLTGGGNLSANRTLAIDNSHIPLGVGQAWQDMSAQRSPGTTYTNTTGRPIFVIIDRIAGATSHLYQVENDSGDFVTVGENTMGAGSNASFVVPAGRRYRTTGTSLIDYWAELR